MQSAPAYPTAALQSQVSGNIHTPPFTHSGLHIAEMIHESERNCQYTKLYNKLNQHFEWPDRLINVKIPRKMVIRIRFNHRDIIINKKNVK